MLGAGDLILFEGLVNVCGQLNLDPRILLLNPMGRSIVQGNPVREDVMGIEPLDQKNGFFHRRESLVSLDLPDLGLITRPFGNERGDAQCWPEGSCHPEDGRHQSQSRSCPLRTWSGFRSLQRQGLFRS